MKKISKLSLCILISCMISSCSLILSMDEANKEIGAIEDHYNEYHKGYYNVDAKYKGNKKCNLYINANILDVQDVTWDGPCINNRALGLGLLTLRTKYKDLEYIVEYKENGSFINYLKQDFNLHHYVIGYETEDLVFMHGIFANDNKDIFEKIIKRDIDDGIFTYTNNTLNNDVSYIFDNQKGVREILSFSENEGNPLYYFTFFDIHSHPRILKALQYTDDLYAYSFDKNGVLGNRIHISKLFMNTYKDKLTKKVYLKDFVDNDEHFKLGVSKVKTFLKSYCKTKNTKDYDGKFHICAKDDFNRLINFKLK